jgi:3-keto-disaccharide hydrolase
MRGRFEWTRVMAGAIGLAAITVLSGAAGQTPASGRGASPFFVPPEPLDYANRAGWTSLFDGRSLAGWDGNPRVWSVENGAITAVSTAERRVGSTHLIWSGGEPSDFELKLEVKLDGDIHSGVAYRSAVDQARPVPRSAMTLAIPTDPKWTLYGPGLDFDADRKMAGNVEERGTPRREIAWRGGVVRAERESRPRLIGTVGDADALMNRIRANDWNQVHIIARGHQLIHIVNGELMTILIDDDPSYFRPSGRIGLQIETYGAGRVSFREIWLREYRP